MKNSLTLMIIALISFIGCKKEKEQNPVDQTLISTVWLTTSEKSVYYNESILPLHEENKPIGTRYVFRDGSKTVNITKPDGTVSQASYAVYTEKGKNYITITAGETSELFEISAFTDKTMTWKQEKTNQLYGQGQTAAKRLTTIEFHCPCRD